MNESKLMELIGDLLEKEIGFDTQAGFEIWGEENSVTGRYELFVDNGEETFEIKITKK